MRIIVIAGPNGAGKTTFATEYLRLKDGPPFVNGDEIAARLNPGDPARAAQQAGRIALRQMETYVAIGEDFAVETTLSGRAYAARIRRWQARGYRVAIIYLRVPSADFAVRRVAKRVGEGGHDIPEAVVHRRFERGWENFVELYRDIADEWQVYDNSGSAPVLLAESESWQGIREPRPTHSQYTPAGGELMTETVRRFPEGEPSTKNVLAALVRARERALARAAAVRRGEAVDGAATGAGEERSQAEPGTSRSAERAVPGVGGGSRSDG